MIGTVDSISGYEAAQSTEGSKSGRRGLHDQVDHARSATFRH